MAGSLEKSAPLTLFGGAKLDRFGRFCTRWQIRVVLGVQEHHGRFYGTLDIKTLGGAGFASQRTTGDDREWDLSDYVGISIDVKKGDKKRYTFIIKDELLPPDEESGREKATISWECDFELPPQTTPGETHDRSVFIPWDSFNPTYRGKLKKDADPLDTTKIKRISVMMRSFFGAQEGDFSLSIKEISALIKKVPSSSAAPSYRGDVVKEMDSAKLEAGNSAILFRG